MCGIAGILAGAASGEVDPAAIHAITAAMTHRGPDGAGSWQDGPCALGHRRLAIIDLSASATQPLASEDGQVIAVVNGEIYNHVELRRDLEAKGHRFRSHSDSEVIVHLYEEVGARTPELLRGMFAFAVWDRREGRLLLARDRAGEKPLVYAERRDGGLAFASEIAALLADEAIATTLDPAALDAYLALQYVPAPHTIFREVHKLPPGCRLEARPGEAPRVTRYHHIDHAPRLGDLSEEEATRRVRDAVDEAVRVRLMSDVPLGAFLSGGIDSSIIVACMARASSRPVKTFAIGFPEASELPYARLVAERWRTDHEEQIVSPRMLDVLPTIVRHHGEPFGDPSAVPTYYLAALTRRRVTVALSGDGGDEAFGGYRRYVWAHLAHLLDRLPRPLHRLVAGALARVPGGAARGVREFGAHLGADEASRYLRQVCHFSAVEKGDLYTADLAARFRDDHTARRFAALLAGSAAADPLARLMDLDRQTYLPDDVLTKVDVATMAHGLESRAPLVDHHVLELAAALPSRWKVRRATGKLILKRAFAADLPPAILGRGKKGFSLPLAQWFRGELRELAHDTLLSSEARGRGLFRPERVEALLARHGAGEDHGDRIWNLLVLELWFREHAATRRGLAAAAPRPGPAAAPSTWMPRT